MEKSYIVMDISELFSIHIDEELTQMRLFINLMLCEVCGHLWRADGGANCPVCDSDDIGSMYDEEESWYR